MALPKSHVAWLRAQSKGHVAAITELRRLRDALAREIKAREGGKWRDPNPKPEGIPGMIAWLEYIERQIAAHEQQAELVRDPRWADALAELLHDPDRAQAATRDPLAYARKLGVKLPPDTAVEFRVVAGRLELSVTGLNPLAPFEFRWTEDGFTSQIGAEAEREAPQAARRRSGTPQSRKRPAARRTT
jgi:hypothetical protein